MNLRKRVKEKEMSNKGITLIALVITIIVLLILAGISIAMLTGENGILTKADTATRETEIVEAKEQAKLDIAEWTAEKLKEGKNANIDNSIIQEILEGKEYVGTAGTDKFTTKKSGYEILYSDLYKDSSIGDSTETGNKPPIPNEFYVVPGLDDVKNGFVISDVPNDTEDRGNQFVWIPVDENDDYQRINWGALEPYWNEHEEEWEAFFSSLGDDEEYLPEGITSEKEAVRKAGGFYVGRYEAGKEEGNENPVSKKGATVWVNISQTDAKEKAKSFNEKSALISGIQWDRVMQFVNGKLDGNGKAMYDVATASITRHIGNLKTAGQNNADKVCNIYDLEGNYIEYIAEKNTYYDDAPFDYRGGYYYTNSLRSATYRTYGLGIAYSDVSFRLVLYV